MAIAEELQKLDDLRRAGTLSEEEFARAKAAVLAGSTGPVSSVVSPEAQAAAKESETRQWAMFLHLSLLAGIIVIATMMLLGGDVHMFVSEHAMIIIFGNKVRYKTLSTGQFYCPQCKTRRDYELRQARNWFSIYFIPIVPLNQLGEFVTCLTCGANFQQEVLSMPIPSSTPTGSFRALL